MMTSTDMAEEGRAWAANLKSLQLRMRNRFRVVVDRQRHRRWLVDHRHDHDYSSYSTILRRWVSRIPVLFAKPSSHLAIRCRRRVAVSEEFSEMDESIIMRMLRSVAVPIIGNACHVFMHGFNHIRVYGAEKLHQALLQRPKGKPLLTVSNHVASIDDPFIIASLLPPNVLFDAESLRWTLCATDRCFSNPLMSAFFQCVKVLPVSRGDGVYQKGMDMALSKLNRGGWVHIFPEGTRSRDGGITLGQPKRGVGRLVMDADDIPLVVPFIHSGMQEVMPIGSSFPKVGKQVTVVIGDPIRFDDLLLTVDDSQYSRSALYDAASQRIGDHLSQLKTEVDKLVVEQSMELDPTSNSQRANMILHQLDWEAFGMENHFPAEECLEPQSESPLLSQSYDLVSTSYSVKMNLPSGGGLVSRVRGFMDPTELMGFAVKGLLDTRKQRQSNFEDVGPVKVWKLYLEENIFGRWYCM
ncbi:uncharacterized protein LOC116245873 [Nymphaea colorata]|nr:uncharacterized protein LOC116245873 [Nymphaea colorata]